MSEHEHSGRNGIQAPPAPVVEQSTGTSPAPSPSAINAIAWGIAEVRAISQLVSTRDEHAARARAAQDELMAIGEEAKARHGLGPDVVLTLDLARGCFRVKPATNAAPKAKE